jgi:hypothetical protein
VTGSGAFPVTGRRPGDRDERTDADPVVPV